MSKRFLAIGFVVAVSLLVAGTYGGVVSANHAWGNYHWERSANPLQLTLGDNVSSKWDEYLDDAIADWNQSSVLSLTKVAGATDPRRCKPANGKIEVCNRAYGNNGWLGIAGISVSGDHINYAYTKVNDTYFDTAQYDTPAWRRLVMCQEVGHDFGLSHQDENFNNANLNTCMDYTSDPESNQHPNAHDYQMLEDIYEHLDSGGGDGDTGSDCNPRSPKCNPQTPPPAFGMELPDVAQWGELLETSQDGGQSTFVQDFGNGHRVYTHVTWTLDVAEQLRERR